MRSQDGCSKCNSKEEFCLEADVHRESGPVVLCVTWVPLGGPVPLAQGSACWRPHAGLNMLQSGLHKQHMKDLFVELCLTVPVRLSSLLPYLPMLMDPLVSALNGSQTLVSQGLRTLELCVDNLQPDFLYDHIQPVRAELMQVSPHPRRPQVPGTPGRPFQRCLRGELGCRWSLRLAA